MKNFIYPLVLFADNSEGCYIGLFPDLDISVYGSTVEETYLQAESSLNAYLQFAIKMDSDVSSASTYQETVGINPKRIVLLNSCQIEGESNNLSGEEENYKNFILKMLVNRED